MRAPALALGLVAAAALVATPVSSASARGWHRGHGGPGLLFPLAIAGAVVGTAAAIATAPVRALGDAAAAPVYAAPAPVYAAPPAYYAAPAAPPAYYPPPPQAYYPPPAAAYYPPPGYAYPYPPR